MGTVIFASIIPYWDHQLPLQIPLIYSPHPSQKILKMQSRPYHSPAHNTSVMSHWSQDEKQAFTFTRKALPWLAPTGSSTFIPHQVSAPAAGHPAQPCPSLVFSGKPSLASR